MNGKLVRNGIGAGIAGIGVLVLGLVLNNQAAFSNTYVHDQLAEHKISFVPVAGLNDAQKQVPCLVANAGKPLLTAKQAECYAKYQIGIDMLAIDGGKGYAEVNHAAFLLRAKVDEAVKSRPEDPETRALVAQSADLSRKGSSLLAGETVKGLLLTAYGFGLLGERGGQAATASFVVAAGLLLTMLVAFGVAAARKRREPNAAGKPVHELEDVRSPVPVG
jgi:hypothetical protein